MTASTVHVNNLTPPGSANPNHRYPPDSSAPEGKARLLYEVAPMGFLAEQAGGMATWGPKADKRVMEVVPQHIHQRSPMFVGSTDVVESLQKFLLEKSAAAV
jgi:fructose-1,6-bisphosphatase I